ncbi:MAG: hypothetical protein KGL39_58730 [Patescibacteria group bacterium]|nr:hypothetical protein [Patescibacteria group bacterium]
MSDKLFKVGQRVFVRGLDLYATVRHHGRDSAGVYTEVEYDDGRREKVHRSILQAKHDRVEPVAWKSPAR